MLICYHYNARKKLCIINVSLYFDGASSFNSKENCFYSFSNLNLQNKPNGMTKARLFYGDKMLLCQLAFNYLLLLYFEAEAEAEKERERESEFFYLKTL